MTFSFGEEIYRPTFPDHPPSPAQSGTHGCISYGLRYTEACVKHAGQTFDASHVYILASKTLAATTSALKDLKDALGEKVVGVKIGMSHHKMWSEIVEVVNECRALDVDLLVTLGASSLSDAAKVITLALANNVHEDKDMKSLPSFGNQGGAVTKPNAPEVPVISIPTTLSGSEYTNYAGATEDSSKRQHTFVFPLTGPSLVILDPELTTLTPDSIYFSTGVRAIDHCVEVLCSLGSNDASDADAAAGLRALVSGLLRTKADPRDLDARHACQMGTIVSIGSMCRAWVPLGGSHAVSRALLAYEVGYGEASCVSLPATCKYNAAKKANVARQNRVLQLLWNIPEIRSLDLDKEKADLGDVLDALIRRLGLPRTLKDVGVEGQAKLDTIAENTLLDPYAASNPAPLKTKEDVLEILRMVEA